MFSKQFKKKENHKLRKNSSKFFQRGPWVKGAIKEGKMSRITRWQEELSEEDQKRLRLLG